MIASDPDARYAQAFEFDVSTMEPMVACPFEPSNIKPVSQVDREPIDQVFIGSCTNNRIEDLRVVAGIFRGHKIHPDIRCIVIPGSVRLSARRFARDCSRSSKMPRPSSRRRVADRAWAAIWACLAPESALSRRAIATSGAWAIEMPRSTLREPGRGCRVGDPGTDRQPRRGCARGGGL